MSQRIPEGEVPDEIRRVNEFLNTIDLETFGDHADTPDRAREALASPEMLRKWLVERGLLDLVEPVTEADRQFAVNLRTALRATAAANSGPAAGARPHSIAADLGDVPLVLRLGATGKPELTSGRGARGALGKLLADVAVATHRGIWERLKICRASDCQWAYYDHSRSRTGRWCAMETCGNRYKTRRYRLRRRTD